MRAVPSLLPNSTQSDIDSFSNRTTDTNNTTSTDALNPIDAQFLHVASLLLQAKILTKIPWPERNQQDTLINEAWDEAIAWKRTQRETQQGRQPGELESDPLYQ